MPVEVSSGRAPKRKKSRLSRFKGAVSRIPGDFVQGAVEAGRGIPTATKMMYQALEATRPNSPIGMGGTRLGGADFNLLSALGKGVITGTAETARHPLRDPFQTLMLAFAFGRVPSSVARQAARAAGKPELAARIARPTRKMEIPPGVTYKGAPPRQPRVVPTKRRTKKPGLSGAQTSDFRIRTTGHRLVEGQRARMEVPASLRPSTPLILPASPNLVTRAGRAALDVPYKVSLARAKKGKGGAYARNRANVALARREALAKMGTQTVKEQLKKSGQMKSGGYGAAGKILRAPGTALRATVYARPRYLAQNLPQAAFFAVQAGVGKKSILEARKLATSAPDKFQTAQNIMGQGGTAAAAIGSSSPKIQQLAAFMNRPESWLRTTILAREAKRHGYKDLETYVDAYRANPYSQRVQLVQQRALDSAVDYGRLGDFESAFLRTQVPIFYPMYKGFSRYAGRFASQHPYQSVLYGQLGAQGGEQQMQELGGAPPWWMPYMTSAGKTVGGRMKIVNPENILVHSPGQQVLSAAGGLIRPYGPRGGENLLQFAGPMLDLAYGGITGRQPQTGYEFAEEELRRGSLLAALAQDVPGLIPGVEFIQPQLRKFGIGRPARSFEEPSLARQLGLWAFGPGYVPRVSKPGVLQKAIRQASVEEQITKTRRKPPKKRRRTRTSKF